MDGGRWSADLIAAALAVAPPIFAPAAFAGLGVVVWLLGSPRLAIRFGGEQATLKAA
jgi:hypothetical protein